MANQGNNQLENIFKSFVQEANNQFQAQGVSIKNLENQVEHIVSALSSRTLGALSSSTKTLAYAPGTEGIETHKVIKLRSRKECEGSTQPREDPPRGILNTPDTSEEVESDPTEETPLEEPVKEKLQNERSTLKTFGMTSAPKKRSTEMLDVVIIPRFVQERSPPPFP